jgi:multisubunit Na+/H+ antiporter MnhB subunit
MGHRQDRTEGTVKRAALAILLVMGLGAVLVIGVRRIGPPPELLRSYFAEHGVEETGSVNLVSSIYLGYRAFDTLGETVVLFLAVAGVAILQGGKR